MGRKQCLLGEIVKFGNGKSRPKTEGIHPIYGGNGILGYTAETNYEGEIIVIGRVGAYCGATYYENRPIWVSDNALAAIPRDNNNAKYLYYFLKNMDLNQHAQGSSHPLVTQTLLNSLDIEISAEEPEQKAIASVLSSLDDKIDLLHRQNKTLEAMAETLFRQWFVEEAQGDWEEKPLSSIAEHKKINVRPDQNPKTIYRHYSIPAFDDGKHPIKELGSEIKSNKYQVLANSILISKLNPRFPRVWAISDLLDDNSICSTEFQVVLPVKSEYYGFIYCFLKSKQVTDELIGAASGTSGSHQRVKPEDIFNLTFQMPTQQKIDDFNSITSENWKRMTNNMKQIRTLEKLRDTLLPKLMSGEVRVKI